MAQIIAMNANKLLNDAHVNVEFKEENHERKEGLRLSNEKIKSTGWAISTRKWDDLKIFINYGMLSQEDFYERAKDFALLKDVEGKYFTFEDHFFSPFLVVLVSNFL